MGEGATELERIAAEASTCTRCRLHQGRTQVVFGQGSPTADLMFVGEGPGFHEDRQGQPFVGPSGQLLNRLLSEIGLRREDVYITNVVRCLGYNAPIQLGDGSWERVGRLVRSRYDGLVMSVDAEGHLVRRRVIGWHASPLAGRRVFRLTYRSAKWAGTRGRVSIQLTGDHEVLTDHGFVPVEQLPPGSCIRRSISAHVPTVLSGCSGATSTDPRSGCPRGWQSASRLACSPSGSWMTAIRRSVQVASRAQKSRPVGFRRRTSQS